MSKEVPTLCRGCKYNVEKVKSKMLRYYNLHKEFPEYAISFRFDSKSSEEILDRCVSMIRERSQVPLELPALIQTNICRGAFLPLPAYDTHGRRILLERCTSGLPLDLIDANCKVVPWSFTQMLYSDKQTQVQNSKRRANNKLH